MFMRADGPHGLNQEAIGGVAQPGNDGCRRMLPLRPQKDPFALPPGEVRYRHPGGVRGPEERLHVIVSHPGENPAAQLILSAHIAAAPRLSETIPLLPD